MLLLLVGVVVVDGGGDGGGGVTFVRHHTQQTREMFPPKSWLFVVWINQNYDTLDVRAMGFTRQLVHVTPDPRTAVPGGVLDG